LHKLNLEYDNLAAVYLRLQVYTVSLVVFIVLNVFYIVYRLDLYLLTKKFGQKAVEDDIVALAAQQVFDGEIE